MDRRAWCPQSACAGTEKMTQTRSSGEVSRFDGRRREARNTDTGKIPRYTTGLDCVSVCPVRAPNSKSERLRKTEIRTFPWAGETDVPIFSLKELWLGLDGRIICRYWTVIFLVYVALFLQCSSCRSLNL